MTIEEMKQRKQELGYTYEKLAILTELPVEIVQAVFEGTEKTPQKDTIKALEELFTFGGQDDWKAVNMIRETQSSYIIDRKQGQYTIKDYFLFPDERRVELIDGVIYDMAAPTTLHQVIAMDICSSFKDYIRRKDGKCVSVIAPVDVQLDCDDKTMVQPDVMIVCDHDKFKDGRIYGAPDLVVEVLSPSTAKRDSYMKVSKYMNAGVKECWLVDPVKKRIYVHEWTNNDAVVELYTFEDEVPVGIFDGECKVDFREIYAYAEFLYER